MAKCSFIVLAIFTATKLIDLDAFLFRKASLDQRVGEIFQLGHGFDIGKQSKKMSAP